MDATHTPLQSRWYRIASIWLGVGLFDATQTVVVMRSEGMHHAWVQLFVTLLLSWLPWALATPFVLRLGRRYPPVQFRPGVPLVAHLPPRPPIVLIPPAFSLS